MLRRKKLFVGLSALTLLSGSLVTVNFKDDCVAIVTEENNQEIQQLTEEIRTLQTIASKCLEVAREVKLGGIDQHQVADGSLGGRAVHSYLECFHTKLNSVLQGVSQPVKERITEIVRVETPLKKDFNQQAARAVLNQIADMCERAIRHHVQDLQNHGFDVIDQQLLTQLVNNIKTKITTTSTPANNLNDVFKVLFQINQIIDQQVAQVWLPQRVGNSSFQIQQLRSDLNGKLTVPDLTRRYLSVLANLISNRLNDIIKPKQTRLAQLKSVANKLSPADHHQDSAEPKKPETPPAPQPKPEPKKPEEAQRDEGAPVPDQKREEEDPEVDPKKPHDQQPNNNADQANPKRLPPKARPNERKPKPETPQSNERKSVDQQSDPTESKESPKPKESPKEPEKLTEPPRDRKTPEDDQTQEESVPKLADFDHNEQKPDDNESSANGKMRPLTRNYWNRRKPEPKRPPDQNQQQLAYHPNLKRMVGGGGGGNPPKNRSRLLKSKPSDYNFGNSPWQKKYSPKSRLSSRKRLPSTGEAENVRLAVVGAVIIGLTIAMIAFESKRRFKKN